MRWFAILALFGACDEADPSSATGGVSLVLDIPNAALDPLDFAAVEVVLHFPSGEFPDIVRAAPVADLRFELGAIAPDTRVSVEATLRNDSGAAVGYGRTERPLTFSDGSEIVIQVRRPIAYIAGTVSRQESGGLRWTLAPATYSDLSVGTSLDGRTQVGNQAVLVITAGPSLFMVTQAIAATTGALTGSAKIAPISTADHQLGAALSGAMTGAVLDGAGADDGSTLVIGTTTQLFAVDTATGATRGLADGNFSRVAILTADTGEINAVAIRNRASATGTCSTTAELWWARLSGDTPTAQRVAIGGFSDVATDRGSAYYIDCGGELGEVTAESIRMLRTITTQGGVPAALAVSNGQAYVGVETRPATTSLLVASLSNSSEPRMLWNEAAQQVVRATDFRGVQRQLDATSAGFGHLEIGAGGDYVALTTTGRFHGDPVLEANFPEITIDTEELRVFDAATGGVVQRYRSWCSGFLDVEDGDIERWSCASTTGQTAAAASYGHHINSMAFLFGKK